MLLLGSFVLFVTGVIIAVLTHLYESQSEVVNYTVVVFICIYAFAYTSTWL